MKTVIIDTNPLLRLLLNDIPHQVDKIEAILVSSKNREILLLIPQIVIFEIEFSLKRVYKLQKREVLEKLTKIIFNPLFEIEAKETFVSALNIHQSQNISLVDSFLLAKIQLERVELFRFDQKLSKLQEKFI